MAFHLVPTGNCSNVRGLGKSKVVFRLFEKLRYSNEGSAKFRESLKRQTGSSFSLYGLGRQATNYKDLYGILRTLRGSHLNNFPRKTLKLGRVTFHS